VKIRDDLALKLVERLEVTLRGKTKLPAGLPRLVDVACCRIDKLKSDLAVARAALQWFDQEEDDVAKLASVAVTRMEELDETLDMLEAKAGLLARQRDDLLEILGSGVALCQSCGTYNPAGVACKRCGETS
jgi:hypothetical protein